jgi:hypothetical protein
MSRDEWSAEQRRAYAVSRAVERRRRELAPLRLEISERIDGLGWRRAKPMVQAAVGRPLQRRGLWGLTRKDTLRVLAALRARPGQWSLFDHDDGPEAA